MTPLASLVESVATPALPIVAAIVVLLGVPLALLARKVLRGELDPANLGARYAEGYADGRDSDGEDES